MEIYKVGGAVRNKLLGIQPVDCDYVVIGSTPKEMLDCGYIQVGRHFPVFLHPETKEEYALARTEKKSGHGYYGFETVTTPQVTLKEDLYRRDLTINAIAEDSHGNLIDPYSGIEDIRKRILRHVSPAFTDDPLRILRVARFAATLDFQVAPETMDLLKQMAKSKEGQYIARERIVHELELALAATHSGNFFKILSESNNLAVFFPALHPLLLSDSFGTINMTENQDKKLTILALSLDRIEHALDQIASNRQIRKYLNFTQLIYDNLQQELNNSQILELLKRTNAIRELNNFRKIITNLIWFSEAKKLSINSSPWLHYLEEIAITLTKPPLPELINNTMNKHDIIRNINIWQLKTIQQIKDCKC